MDDMSIIIIRIGAANYVNLVYFAVVDWYSGYIFFIFIIIQCTRHNIF